MALPRDVERFLRERVGAVNELELLLLLQHRPERSWSAAQASKVIYQPVFWVGRQFETFVGEGFARRIEVDPLKYRWAVADEPTDRLVREVADAFRRRRTTVIREIFRVDTTSADRLADAFRLREPSDDDPG